MRSAARLAELAVPATLALVLGCSATDPVEAACGGARPSFEDCVIGSTWARCGDSEGEPRFACGSHCWWFEGGCVPEGLDVSPCGADDLCCVSNERGGLPFEVSGEIPMAGYGPTVFLVGWGPEPWPRERARDVEVELGALTPIEGATATCTPEDDFDLMRGICGCPGRGLRQWDEDVFVAVGRSSCVATLSWELWVEVTRDDDDSLHARVCRIATTDAGIIACPEGTQAICADAGTVTLDAFPESLEEAQAARVDLSVSFPDDVTIDAQL